MKTQRQQAILQHISRQEIETQDDLISLLTADGYKVTQATISRDIRELKISKVLGSNGKYRYSVAENISSVHSVHKEGLKSTYSSAIISIENAENIIVIKTHPGLAQAVAAGIDAMHLGGILGCVAGDDTIITVARDFNVAVEAVSKLKEEVRAN